MRVGGGVKEFCLSAWKAGVRGRSIQVIAAIGLFLMGVAYLSASFSPRQPQTVALDVGFSFLRIILVLLGLFWVQELIAREVERRTVIFSVSYPVSRSAYLLGRCAGMALLLAVAALCLAVLLWGVTFLAGRHYAQQYPVDLGGPFWATVFGLWIDAMVVSCFGVLLSTLSTVSVLPLAVGICFAIAAKTVGFARSYILSGADGDDRLVARMAPLLDIVRWMLPDLGRVDWRGWAMYRLFPGVETMFWGGLAAIAYGVIVLALACWAFRYRELG